MIKNILKNDVYEEFYNIVNDSTEWGIDADSSKYGYYIDGVVSMAQTLLEKFNDKATE